MATTKDPMLELEGIWRATRRAERRHRIDTATLALFALGSGACLVLGLAHVYTSLAGLP